MTDIEPSAGDLVLRVCNSSRGGQIVRLKSAKCTIGSGPRCTLRLRARDVAPMHCLIVRGRASTVVRRWAGDTRLNHRSFTDAPLCRGDHLSIGPIELEVMSIGVAPMATEPPGQQWHAEQAEAARRLEEQREQLSTRFMELASQQKVLAEERRLWEAQKDENRSRMVAKTEQLNARESELEDRQKVLVEERRLWETQQNADAGQTATQQEQLNTQLAELEAARNTLERREQEWQTEQADAQRRLDARRDELDARQSELEARQRASDEERRQWEAQRNESVRQSKQDAEAKPTAEVLSAEPEFKTPSEGAPVDLADVFRRLGAKVEVDEEEPAPVIFPRQVEPPAADASPSPATASPVSAPAKAEEEEESIDDYMSRLMQRVRSTGDSAATSYAPPPPRPVRNVQATSETAAKVESPKPQAIDERPPAAMAPRRVAPETATDLSALRELANLSAHSALGQHSRKILTRTTHAKLAVALVALATGGALLWMWNSFSTTQMTYYSALAALLITFYWGLQYAMLTGRLIVSKSGQINIDWKGLPYGQKAAPPNADDVTEKDAGQKSPTTDDGSPNHAAVDSLV